MVPSRRRAIASLPALIAFALSVSCTHHPAELDRRLGFTRPRAESVPSTTLPANSAVDLSLAADYRSGDGEGFNLRLSLHADGTFSAIWTGCLGTYGTASGLWARAGDRITFVNQHATDMLIDYLCRATVIPNGSHAALILEQDEPYYRERGPHTPFTLHLASEPPYWLSQEPPP